MKRVLLLLVVVMCCICLAACDFEDSLFGERRTHDDEIQLTPTPVGEADYFGNQSVEFEKENARYRVSFSFLITSVAKYVPQEATIHLTITNEEGEVVYRKDHEVTERDYVTPNNNSVGMPLIGYIYIKSEEITPGLSARGTLAISAELSNGTQWDVDRLGVYALPLKTLKITMPSTPLAITEYDYRGGVEKREEVLNVTYEVYEYGTVNLNATVKLVENNDNYSSMNYCKMNYKLKNSAGVIVTSGILIAGPLDVGDAVLCNQVIAYDLDRNEEYTLELVDYR